MEGEGVRKVFVGKRVAHRRTSSHVHGRGWKGSKDSLEVETLSLLALLSEKEKGAERKKVTPTFRGYLQRTVIG